MRDILPEIERWNEAGERIALATVIRTWGSAPRPAGAKMALTPGGKIAGSVSGGCVENAVVEAGTNSLKHNKPQLLYFGITDEDAWSAGLSCGGSLDVFVAPLDPAFFHLQRDAWYGEARAALVTVVRGPDDSLGHQLLFFEDGRVHGSLGADLDREAPRLANELWQEGASARCVSVSTSVELFIEAIAPRPTLVVLGGVHIAIPLTALASMLGYRTVVIDPRRAWGNADRFPHVDRLIQDWPDEAFAQVHLTSSTAVAVLTHDPKLDDIGLRLALASDAFYVGALGSRVTQDRRRQRLLAAGLTEAQLARLHGPIGIGIAARTPEEIALAITAEVVDAHRRHGERTDALVKQRQAA